MKAKEANKMQTVHEERDGGKTQLLIEDMSVNGWQGCPLVADGDQLITGTHRYIAAQALDIAVPTIQLDELYALAGLNMVALHETHGSPTINELAFVDFLSELPTAMIQEYGIDIG